MLARKLVIDMCERFKRAKPDELRRYAADPGALEQDGLLATTDSSSLKRQLDFSENYDGIPGVHRIRLAATWEARSGRTRSISLSRLIHAH